MAEFGKLRFKELIKDEVISWGPNVVKIITPFDPVALGLTPVLNEFQVQWDKLVPYMQNSAGSVLTDDITDKDGLRDKDLVGIKLYAKSVLYHRNAAKVAAAELVLSTMDSFDKNIPKQSIAVQTETVVKLVKLFETDAKVKAAMDLIGLTEWVPPLKATNEELGDTFIDRTREDGDKPDKNFLEQRPMALAVHLKLLKVIDAKNTLAPDPKLDQIIGQVNELIAKYNQMVAQRKGRAGKGGTGNGANPTPPTP